MIENKLPENEIPQASNSPIAGKESIISDDMPKNSRLSRKASTKSKQTIVLSILAIIGILFLLFRYGIPIISDASFLFGKVTGGGNNEETIRTKDEAPVPSPDLDSLPKATKDPSVKVTGTSLSGLKVALYLNGSKEEEKDVSEDGSFEFNIELSEGDNIIRAKAIRDGKESENSNTLNVALKNEGPELTIDFPSENAELKGSNPFEVRGKTDPDVKVTVNDFQAVSSSGGSYSYLLTLKGGDNEIKVIATDLAGNKTEKTIRVKYSQ